MAKKTDQQTLKLIEEVKKRKADIAKSQKPCWKTNCTFTFIEGDLGKSTNIKVEKDLVKLIGFASFLKSRADNYAGVAKELAVEDAPEFAWNGFSVADWIDDLKTRIAQIQIETKKSKLEKLENRLDKIISPDLRAEMELAAIADELD